MRNLVKLNTSSQIKLVFIFEYILLSRSENSGVPLLFGGHNLPPPMVKIGLIDPPNRGTPGFPRDDTPDLEELLIQLNSAAYIQFEFYVVGMS